MDMPTTPYATTAPDRAAVDALAGATVLEFGTDWCGHCKAAQPFIGEALADRPGLRHMKIEDGPGRPLGRSYRVKLWPTLVFLQDGQEVGRTVRPPGAADIRTELARLAA